MNFGFGELVVIFLIVIVIFGAGKLPQLGDALGRGIKNFKKATKDDDEVDVTPRASLPPQSAGESAKADAKQGEKV